MAVNGIFDLAVIGAGPAGSAAAVSGARKGLHVLLLEAGNFPRQKVCGEFVSAEAIGLLQGLLTADHHSLIKNALQLPQARLFMDGREAALPVNPAAVSLSRFDLDAALWDSARQHRVITQERTRIRQVERAGDVFHISAENTEFNARAVIDSSGRWSELRPGKSGSHDKRWIGIKAHFYESNPPLSCDLYFFDGGYCGVLPLENGQNGIVNAAAMVRADVAKNFEEIFTRSSRLEQRMRRWKPVFTPVSTSPLIFKDPQTSYGDMLLAGDAAGFIDPFAGDGISLALHSGSSAATILARYLHGEIPFSAATQLYEQWYREHLLPAFAAARRLRFMTHLPRLVRRISLSALGMPLLGSAAVRLTRARTVDQSPLVG